MPYKGKEQDIWALGVLLYTMLNRENPFRSIEDIRESTLYIPHKFGHNKKNLVRSMLNRDIAGRIKIEEVVEHPWILSDSM